MPTFQSTSPSRRPLAKRTICSVTIFLYICNSKRTMLILNIGEDVARTGEVFCDDPIAPDVVSETPLEDAIKWIESYKQ